MLSSRTQEDRQSACVDLQLQLHSLLPSLPPVASFQSKGRKKGVSPKMGCQGSQHESRLCLTHHTMTCLCPLVQVCSKKRTLPPPTELYGVWNLLTYMCHTQPRCCRSSSYCCKQSIFNSSLCCHRRGTRTSVEGSSKPGRNGITIPPTLHRQPQRCNWGQPAESSSLSVPRELQARPGPWLEPSFPTESPASKSPVCNQTQLAVTKDNMGSMF